MLYLLATIGAVVTVRRLQSLYRLLFLNRDGNSGRYKHWLQSEQNEVSEQ
jgi:hypothetical protein